MQRIIPARMTHCVFFPRSRPQWAWELSSFIEIIKTNLIKFALFMCAKRTRITSSRSLCVLLNADTIVRVCVRVCVHCRNVIFMDADYGNLAATVPKSSASPAQNDNVNSYVSDPRVVVWTYNNSCAWSAAAGNDALTVSICDIYWYVSFRLVGLTSRRNWPHWTRIYANSARWRIVDII